MTQTIQTLKLNKQFYAKEAIDAASDSFKELCVIDVDEQEKEFTINIKMNQTEQHSEEFAREFANHCLAAMR